jgi:shikimate kinase / 3-dehydroquinate synthase
LLEHKLEMSALDRHVALVGFMGAGKTTVGKEVAERIGRPFRDRDREIEAALSTSIASYFVEEGEEAFRKREAAVTVKALRDPRPSVLALGGGAVTSAPVREELKRRATTVLLEVDVETAWERASGEERPLAQERGAFSALFDQRQPVYRAAADAVAADADDVVLAAGGVHVELGSLERLGELVPGDGPVALVTDTTVAGIHGADAQLALGSRLVSAHELPPREPAKTTAACERLWNELRLERDGTLVALGGGCVTDVAGFVAATYMRGIDWVAVPTTLVGQVDAAIGGKTAVNVSRAKNLAGAFHWPVRTVVDPAVLATLPAEERLAGMAEAVKTGLLAGERLWELPDTELVRRCAAFKTAVCLRDPTEQGERRMLNLGHTFAHALEAASGYELPHGRAVALGLLAALRLSGLPTADVEKVLAPEPVRVDSERAWAALQLDKKATGGRPRLVLLEEPGKPVVDSDIPEADIRRALTELVSE